MVKFFLRCRVSLVTFIYWSKFHFNIITGSGVRTIGNIPVEVLSNVLRLGEVGNTKFDTNISNKKIMNFAKYHGYSFYCFRVVKGKPRTGVKLPPTQVKTNLFKFFYEVLVFCFLQILSIQKKFINI